MKIKKNYFRFGKKKHFYIKFSENINDMIKEIKGILKIFIKKNVKAYFTGFFRSDISEQFRISNFVSKSRFYALDDVNQIDILLDKKYINFIVNLEFYLFPECNEFNSKFDIEKNVANLYLENCFTECGLIFDKKMYDETEILNHLRKIVEKKQ